jgi:hypothetical protein
MELKNKITSKTIYKFIYCYYKKDKNVKPKYSLVAFYNKIQNDYCIQLTGINFTYLFHPKKTNIFFYNKNTNFNILLANPKIYPPTINQTSNLMEFINAFKNQNNK